jgi:LPS export ABC transporter protein LptC
MGKNKARGAAILRVIILTAPMCLFACRFNYGELNVSDALAKSIPDIVLENYESTSVDNGKVIFRIAAKRAELFEAMKETHLSDVSFAEYDSSDGAVITSGRAATAVYFTDTENAEISGDLYVYSRKNGASLEGAYLYWDKAKKTLVGRRDRLITIKKDDGSLLKGEGFSADAKTRSIEYLGHAEGQIFLENSDTTNE